MAHLGGRLRACQGGTRAWEAESGRFALRFSCRERHAPGQERANKSAKGNTRPDSADE